MNKCGYVKFEVQKNVTLNYIAFQISSEEKQMVHSIYFLGSTMKAICFVDIKMLISSFTFGTFDVGLD